MATTKVSALSAKTSLAGSEELLITDCGTSKKVTATNLLAGVTVADGAISTAKLAADAVTGAKIADDAIDSEHYTDGSIDTAHIADDAVTAAKLANSINTDIATGVTANTTANAALPKSGGAMTGAITTNSTFDGRDVATDGAKLDGIEASADVTDATNVAAAGALMDSEVTNLAQVKAFDSSDYATAAQGTTADAALPKAGGTMTGNIAHASDFTIDVGGDITLDADGGDVKFSDGGTQFASVELNSTEVYFESAVSDNDIKIRGNDGGSTINMLSFDTSEAGKATFNASVTARTDTDTSNTGSVTLDFSTNQNFVLTLTGNVTLANPTTETVGQSGFITFIQDSTGSRTVSLGTDYETAGGAGLTLTSTASATDIVPYVVVASGRILLGAPQLAFA